MDGADARTVRDPGVKRRGGLVLTALRAAFRRVLVIYFRDIEIAGDVPDAHVRGRLFAANHVNGLVDPLLVLVFNPAPVSPVGKAPLWKIPVLRALLDAVDAVPIVRRRDDPDKSAAANDEVFARVGAHLAGGGNILIFPEGTSHNEPHLVKLRSGAGRMLARAREDGGHGLTFQAVGLEFEARDIFRSRALLTYGPVRSVDALGSDETTLAATITTMLAEDLARLLVEGETFAERRLIGRVAEMFADDARDPSLAGWSSIGQVVEATRAALAKSAPDRHRAIERAIDAYFVALEAAGLGDAEVVAGGRVRRPGEKARAALLLLTSPLALLGVPLYFLPYQVPRLVARAASTDVASTYKLASGLVVFPLWATALVALLFVSRPLGEALLGTAIVLAAPFATLAWLDRTPKLGRALATLLASPRTMTRLREQRDAVMRELASVRATFEGTT